MIHTLRCGVSFSAGRLVEERPARESMLLNRGCRPVIEKVSYERVTDLSRLFHISLDLDRLYCRS